MEMYGSEGEEESGGEGVGDNTRPHRQGLRGVRWYVNKYDGL